MIASDSSLSNASLIGNKARAFFELLKFRLAALVAFSGAFGYSLAVSSISWPKLGLFCLAAIAITGAANIINQIIEKDLDKLMKRTADRPLPSGRLTVQEAVIWGIFLGVTSLLIFAFYFNVTTALLAALSTVLYGFVYTPLKRVGPIAVFCGGDSRGFPTDDRLDCRHKPFLASNRAFCLPSSFFGSFRTSGPLPGYWTKIIKGQASKCSLPKAAKT